ncbi:MAG: hypothetical protein WAZ98_13915 [Cyclobacteriaceae bacterium]
MKNLITFLIGLFFLTSSFAQDDEVAGPDAKAQEKIKAARIAFITERLGLTPEEAEKFWPVYREFSLKRQDLKKQFKDNRKNPDPNKTVEQNEKDAIELGLKLKQQELDLEREYSGKLLKVVPAQKVMALRKAEDDFRKLLIDQIQKRQAMQQQRQKQLDKNDQRQRQRNN